MAFSKSDDPWQMIPLVSGGDQNCSSVESKASGSNQMTI